MSEGNGRPLLFYSAWPLGYHNVEAERKARAFSGAGYDVVYVAGIGARNPSLASAGKLADRLARKLQAPEAEAPDPAGGPGLRTAALAVLPPRQLRPLGRLNAAWVERQLRTALPRPERALAWVRWPTPELVDALAALAPAAIVYECVDAYRHSPGITGRWVEVFELAERALVERAALVVTSNETLAEGFEHGPAPVRVLPHGVDLMPVTDPPRRPREPGEITVGLIGTLDMRLDAAVLRHVAERRPRWRLRLVGPVQDGFDPRAFADLSNVSVEGPIAHARVPELLADFDVGIMPYRDHPHDRALTPVKNLELMAAGKPAVARRLPYLERFEDLVYFAQTPEEFECQLDRAVREDSPARRDLRRAEAERHSWKRRLREMRAIATEALAIGGERSVLKPSRPATSAAR